MIVGLSNNKYDGGMKMEKRLIRILTLTVCACLLISGCAAVDPSSTGNIGNMGNAGKETQSPDATPEATPLSRNPDKTNDDMPLSFPDEIQAKINLAAQKDAERALNVPVYWQDALIYSNPNEDFLALSFGRDYGYSTAEHSDYGVGIVSDILYRLPTDAIRVMNSGDYIYFMYDTDQGQRVYLFSNRLDGREDKYYGRLSGLPVIMEKTLAYKDYAGVEKGMEISELAQIDPVMATYSDFFYDTFSSKHPASWKKYGIPVTTISILKDGALKITFVVDTIEFSEDFTFEGYYETICYRIAEVDYKG